MVEGARRAEATDCEFADSLNPEYSAVRLQDAHGRNR